jgi:phosphohistidine phosphatase SixA
MKKTILLLLTVSTLHLSCNRTTQEQTQTSPVLKQQKTEDPTQIFLVRHAEKSTNDPRDPDLSPAGKERAEKLKYHLAEAGITAIYTTDYKRTQQTVQPLAEALGIEPIIYATDLIDITQILQDHSSGNVLVAGHSNTTPKLANKLLDQEKYQSLDESVYNKLFIVTKSADQFTAIIFQY